MKPYRILRSFPGSQTGHDHDHFAAGTIRDLSDGLAAIVVKAGWAERHIGHIPADERETKIVVPDEIKDDTTTKKKKKG